MPAPNKEQPSTGRNTPPLRAPFELPASKELACWQTVQQSLAEGNSALLLVVTDASSGSPGRQGFKMVITEDGKMSGTIGGGVMEYRIIQKAADMLASDQSESRILRQEHTQEACSEERSGMICSGYQVIALCPIRSQQSELINTICSTLESGSGGSFTLSKDGISIETESPNHPIEYLPGTEKKNDWSYQEQLSPHHTMHIIGGGHVGTALSRVMRTLDFYVKIYDHREDLHLLTENPWAHEKVITPYANLAILIPEGAEQFVSIVSTTFKTDEAALRALAGKHLGYLGVMGSSTKITRILEALEQDGIGNNAYQNLHAPIGLPIQSHTAEEIAVSIAAEAIQVKNGQKDE
jgi:xanthine dehydrogenase accessory factor